MSDSSEPNDPERASETDPSNDAVAQKTSPLRMLPAVALVLLMPLAAFLPSLMENGPSMLWMVSAFGPLLCSLMILCWWGTFSRATWKERLLGGFGLILGLFLTGVLVDPSMRGPAFMMLTIPLGFAGFALAAYAFRRKPAVKRSLQALLVGLLAMGSSVLVRAEGMWGNFSSELHWRWTPSSEEQAIASRSESQMTETVPIAADFGNPEWPRFRGPLANAEVPNLELATDWTANAPELLWKTPIGPGWSSFVVAGNAVYTQQQLGEEELVTCLDLQSGQPIWNHSIATRFDEAMGGPGPRATPAVGPQGLFVLGANGDLMRLDPLTGESVWQIRLPETLGVSVPMWGFSSSPLLLDNAVIIHAAGSGDNGVVAFDPENGEVLWKTASGKMCYSSPQPAVIGGTLAILMATNEGLDVLSPAHGEKLLAYEWPHGGYRACQPQVIQGNQVLIPTGMGTGSRLIRILKGKPWKAEEVWSTLDLKPDFNDFVVHEGHAYGFDNAIFVSIDLATGKRNWKRGRYGKGQVLLLSDSDLLLVVTEKGETVLVRASPDSHEELASFKMLDGKSWAHPAIVNDLLLLRNSREAACYRLRTR